MTTALRNRDASREIYNRDLSAAWRNGTRVWEPSVWLSRDPDAENKMLLDHDIGHAVGYRQKLVAGRQWDVVPKAAGDTQGNLATAVATELLSHVQNFTQSRLILARAFFHGARFGKIHGTTLRLSLGDGQPRTWWVPTSIEDHDKKRFQKRTSIDASGKPSAWWEKWNVWAMKWQVQTEMDMVDTIAHVYQDDESSLGYGQGLREALGWLWDSKVHAFSENMQAVQRFAQGIKHAKIDGLRDGDSGMPNVEVMNKWVRALDNMFSGRSVVTDRNDDLTIIPGNAEGWELLKHTLDSLKSSIFTLVLGANLTTAGDKGGSYALAEVQENSTEALVQFDREALEETLTRDLLGCVWWHNYANLVELGIWGDRPRFNIRQEKKLDPQVRATVAQTLHGMGVALAADDLYEQTGFRKPVEGEEVIAGQVAMPALPGLGTPDDSQFGPLFQRRA